MRFVPKPSDYAGLRHSWGRDLAAGVTVGIVALPLALGFSVATGVGAAPGLVTAVIAGAVAAVCGGSHIQVSGPTGAMTVVLVPLVAKYGTSVVYPIAILAGIVLLVAGLLRLGRLLAYIPWPLVEGFTLGIAIAIAAQQIPSALGIAKPDIENAAGAAAVAIARFAQHPQWTTLGLLALSVVLTAALPRLHRSMPASLVAVVVVTLVAAVSGAHVALIGALPAGLPTPSLPGLGGMTGLLPSALVVAFLAGLESLLSARVADGMSDAPRHDPDRELFGQGLANIASGLCGGLPATGAIARTAVNARSGAKTRVAALTHALLLAAIIYAASGLVGRIPLVALAGVLLVVAYRMVERHTVRAVLRSTRGDALVFGVTAVCTVAFDLVTAVEAGLAVAVVLALARMAKTAQAVAEPLSADGLTSDAEHVLLTEHVLVYRLDGPLFFAVAARFLAQVTATADVRVVILRLSGMSMLDATGARALGEIVDELSARGIIVLFKGATSEHARLLAAVGTLAPVLARGHVFATLAEAVTHATKHVRESAPVIAIAPAW
ncbi:MAG: sulfate transporter [Amycolatopsis sp.]|uniref:SulP family inorganic anion transporter n=1 Tax=Amycolatopsis sp. TaxID=37632 RepID=UPI0026208418|nr:SulP family inorganic anion transporter [Amycolatopsis sp.]MCU1683036.1 sulfate transporter [Amycolatopsis sp.]